MKIPRLDLRPSLASLAVILVTSCGGGGGGGGGDNPGGGNLELAAALNDLGVDTSTTPRRDEDGDALPADYAPFGATWELAKTNELVLLGVDMNATGNPFSLVDLTSDTGSATLEVLEAIDGPSWTNETRSSRALPATLRTAISADVDGDGLEEGVVVFQRGLELHALTVEDEPSGFAQTDHFLGLEFDVSNVAARAGDLDGDGIDELAIALTEGGPGGTVELVLVQDTPAGLAILQARRKSLAPVLASSVRWAQLATGNIDQDRAEELVLVVNEEFRDFFGTATQSSTFHVYDDLGTGLAELLSGPVQGRDQTSTLRSAIVATPAIGDVDGDGVGEVLLGGLTQYARFCNTQSYFLLALDDADRGLAPLAGRFLSFFWDDCDSPADSQVRTVYLNALDIDGDGRDEVQANLFVFQDFVEAAPWTEVAAWRLPEAAFFRQGNFNHFDLNTSAVVTGDFTGDGREDVALYRQDTTEIGVWGVSAISQPPAISKMRSVPVAFHNSQTPVNPVLVALNTDTDSPVLRYDEGKYELVFTEPIVLAALAAAPFKEGIGQNVAACRTAFGNTESAGSESERAVTTTVSGTAGVNLSFPSQSAFELTASVTRATRQLTTHAYTLSKTILFTSGSNEDLVVFTTVPIDQYTYTVLSHPDPALVGEEVVVSLPRDMITLQAEREFYNRTVKQGSTTIGAGVFQHAKGDPTSYPSRTGKGQILSQSRHGQGLQIGPISVGQGTGETELTLEVGTEFSTGSSLELGWSADLEVTGFGVLLGFSVGSSTEDTLRVTSGVSTTYTGVVGAIDQQNFAANRYSFGLFTYVHHDPFTGREFEVLNYWTE